MPMVELGASGQEGDESAMHDEIQELKDENERLRKSLTLLHTHSLRIQDQLDTLLGHRNALLDACEAVAAGVPEGPRADEYSRSSVGPLAGATCELTDEPMPDGWTTLTAWAEMAG